MPDRPRDPMPHRSLGPIVLLVAAAVLAACGSSSSAPGNGAPDRLAVMTQNLYLGASLDPVFAGVTDPAAAVATLWTDVQASDPPGRMARVADEIAARKPDLVGLQEAALFQATLSPAPETTVYDFVTLIQARLQALGESYTVVAQSRNFSQQLPVGTSGLLVRFTDRDVILARSGVVVAEPLNDQHFSNQLQVPFGLGLLPIPRGWCSAVADRGAGPVRFVNTHLEAASRQVQEAQGGELVAALAGEQRRVVLVGDLNSPADGSESATYANVRNAGYADSWGETHPGDPGLTCCFQPDLKTGSLTSRIDLALHRGSIAATGAEVVGEEQADRTAGGLAPSDHAGVSATLQLR